LRHKAKLLGGDVAGRNRVLCPGPGHSPKDRSLSVTFAGEDFTVHSFTGDDWRECRDYVRHRLGLGDFAPIARRPAPMIGPPSAEERDRTQRAGALWSEARSITGTPAEAYLASRGVSYRGEALRWHPSCPFGKGVRYGCMVAPVRSIITNALHAVHRTAIDAKGRKIDRKAYGPIGGGAIELTDDADVTTAVGIGEGIETTLSIRRLPGLSELPVWSVISANGIANFPVLPGIECVWIAVDNDASGTGQEAASTAAERLNAAGIEVILVTPTEVGADLNDEVAHA